MISHARPTRYGSNDDDDDDDDGDVDDSGFDTPA